MSMKELAQHIIAVAHENQLSISNLQLQKVMYFSFKIYAKNHRFETKLLDETYDEKFLVWKYGPVIKDIYEDYSMYGSTSISEENEQVEQFRELNETIISELKQAPFQLVEKTHQEEFWREHQRDISGWRSNVEYSIENIVSDS